MTPDVKIQTITATKIPIAVSFLPYPGLLPIARPMQKNAMVRRITELTNPIKPWFNNKNHPTIAKTKVKTSISDIIKGSICFL